MLQWIRLQFIRSQKTVITLGVFLVAVFSIITPFSSVHAQTTSLNVSEGLSDIQGQTGLSGDLGKIIGNIVNIVFGLIGAIIFILFFYAGYLWMTAAGNEEQVENAKRIIKNAIIGAFVVLCSYALAQGVMYLFGVGRGGPSSPTGPGAEVGGTNFEGSGALGGIVKDHYPARNQNDVARNTKIIITFRKPIKIDSIADNTNNSKDKDGKDIFGDCINIGESMNWKTDCDTLKLDNEHINISRTSDGEKIGGATVLATYQNGKVYSIVIRPHDPLGSASEKIGYKVRIGKAVLLDDALNGNPSIFNAKIVGNDYYEWQFTCSTALDVVPPTVRSTFPGDKTTEAKNTVIQIDFNEAMDPTGLQGVFSTEGSIYKLLDGVIYLKSGSSTVPVGNFTLTNGYRTLEFSSTKVCGVNSCGNTLFCLPVCDRAGASCKQDVYEVLVKAARTFSATVFESIPFSGAMDVAGNALDGNANGRVDTAPSAGSVFPDQQRPDNFSWSFIINDVIDNTAPHLRQVTPGLDAQFIAPDDRWGMVLSKRMRADSLYSIGIDQKPADTVPLCYMPRAVFNTDGTTDVDMMHCPFIKNKAVYYFPKVTSDVEDVHYNCFFPGKGPGGIEEAGRRLKESSICDASGKNCCAVSSSTPNGSFCCNGIVTAKENSTDSCVKFLKDNSSL